MSAPRNHVVIIDGTMSSLERGRETHAGALFRLLEKLGPKAAQSFRYHPGVQGDGWRRWWNAMTGEGLNDAILNGYSAVASRYQPGDRIFLFGYSRGAYAVRSLAGLIARVGLLQRGDAAERRVRRAFTYYKARKIGAAAAAFRREFCHSAAEITMIGVWDTVSALGPPYPIFSHLGGRATAFHDASLGPHIRAGYHAIAIDENRRAFRPVLWRCPDGGNDGGRLQQAWFPGAHGDVGGEIDGEEAARPLANLPLRWMLARAERHGLLLPEDWRRDFPVDAAAPAIGPRHGLGKFFIMRAPRRSHPGRDGEMLHASLAARRRALPSYRPRARIGGD